MRSLDHRHLTTLHLVVDFAGVTAIGQTAAGSRGIAPVTGGHFAGPVLNGVVDPGSDWFINLPDGNLAIDVRLTLRTDDGAAIYLSYQGKMIADSEAMARFRKGEQLAEGEYSLNAIAKFECGDERYRWLNNALAIAIGEQTPTGPIYTIYEVTS